MTAGLLPQRNHSVKTRLEKSTDSPYRLLMIRGLIFDLDGTLVDSLPGIATALNHALEENQLPTHSVEAIESFIGDGLEHLVKRALAPDLTHHFDQILPAFQKHYSQDWKSGTLPYPGIMDLLSELHASGMPMAVLSNKPHLYTVEIVEALFPAHFFSPIQGHRAEFPKKPDPTTALKIVSDWNLTPSQAAYVGDSTVDLATAKAGNLIPLIFSWGYGTPTDFPLLHNIADFKNALTKA